MEVHLYETNDYILKYTKEKSAEGLYVSICGIVSGYECYDIEIPKEIDGVPVTEIAERAFMNEGIETIALPEGLVTIRKQAFEGCDCLDCVSFPSSLRKIEENAFHDCTYLETVTFNEGLEIIEDSAFQNTIIERLTLPDSLITIGMEAFNECELFEVNLGSKLQTIELGAFANNGKLENINFPEGLKTIGPVAFENCGLVSVILPNGLTYLDFAAFDGCDYLESLHIGDNLAIDDYDRTINPGNNSLKNISVSKNNKNFKIIDGCLYDMYKKELIRTPSNVKDVIIPKWVNAITPECFYDIYPDSITIRGESLKYIEESFIENADIVYCVSNSPVEDFLKEEEASFANLKPSLSDFLKDVSDEKDK